MNFHRGKYLQRGRGIGSVLASFFNTVLPVAKSIGQSIINSPLTKQVLTTAKNSAIDAGLNIAADALSGENIGRTVKKNLAQAGENIGQTIRAPKRRAEPTPTKKLKKKRTPAPKKVVTKRRKKIADIYD